MTGGSLTLQGGLHEIERAQRFAEQFCEGAGLGAAHAKALALILEELITNTVKHGDPPEHAPIALRLARTPDGSRLVYRDRGRAFDPTRDIPAQDLSATLPLRPTGGLGWPLIEHYASDVAYRRDGDENVILLDVPREPEID